ncbi:MAG: mechanosensitive ion channel family protein, partial [Pseudolabrys sp.]
RAPVGIIRDKLAEIVKTSKNWDGNVVNLQVTDAKEVTIELRCLMSARSAGQAFDLRCEVREQLIGFLQKHHPKALPHRRAEVSLATNSADLPPRRAAAKRGKPASDN